MCGIFAYLNFLTPKTRSEIIDVLIKGLQRMEYRGYDSAGIAIGGEPGTPDDETVLIRKAGKVSNLAESIKAAIFCSFRAVSATQGFVVFKNK
ncbi:hypothetical protein Y032_0024g887 [Ancylostoma ceylanicum]|uniref:glutamine--fructose-6-phosphate transaminase (isomerizing) n=1 Tax=Ancylostoma ceylanicum TaxID=53326 RepID=A0A016UXJ1_9BILA|nr:hypothetical protein Y032_0024g887 [Ancylostoma ceylanicum]